MLAPHRFEILSQRQGPIQADQLLSHSGNNEQPHFPLRPFSQSSTHRSGQFLSIFPLASPPLPLDTLDPVIICFICSSQASSKGPRWTDRKNTSQHGRLDPFEAMLGGRRGMGSSSRYTSCRISRFAPAFLATFLVGESINLGHTLISL